MSFGLRPSHLSHQHAPDGTPAFFICRALLASRLTSLCLAGVCTLALRLAVQPVHAQATVPALTPIYAIQGAGAASPLQGRRVTTVGLVSGVTVDGFFVQDPGGDGDPATSDGLFVYTWERPSVQPGQCVRVVDGLVTEFYGKTELARSAAVVPASGCQGALQPVDLPPARLGVSPTLALEPWEGMLVRLPHLAGTVHGPTHTYAGGEKELALLPAHLARAVRPGHLMHDQPEAATLLTYVNNRLGADLPEAAFGQELSGPPNLLAVVDYAFGKVQVLPLPGQPLTLSGHHAPPLPIAPTAAGEYTVCSYNLNGLGRGAEQFPDPNAYAAALAQRAQTLAGALQGCTIVALQETGTPSDAQALAAALAAHGLDYTATAYPGPASADREFPLTNSLLTRRDRVDVLDAFVSQGCSTQDYGVMDPGACAPGQFPLFDRPPLLAHLEIQGAWQGEVSRVWVIDNHWKSKAGDETVNAVRRLAQAEHVAAQVQALVDAAPDARVIVAGDLNDFYGSRPLAALLAGTQPPLLHPFDFLPALDRYTYVYNGAAQALDHLVISENLGPALAGVQVVHLHADFAAEAAPVPATDHDPVVLRIRPGGAAATGGDLGFAQIAVSAVSRDGLRLAAALTDGAGEYRLWGLPPGALTLHFDPPPGVTLTPSMVDWKAVAGYHPAPMPQVHHQTAVAAAALAVATPDLAVRSFALAQQPTP